MTRTTNRNRRGSTLIELTITMALISIVSVMIVSFSALISQKTKENQKKYEFIEETSIVRDLLIDWLSSVDRKGNTVTVTENEIIFTESSYVSFDFETQTLTLKTETWEKTHTLKSTETISFEAFDKDTGDAKVTSNLMKCTFGTSVNKEQITQPIMLSLRVATMEAENG